MNNLLSYYGLTDSRMSASEKDLPVAIAEFFWKMQRKTWYSIMGLDAMPFSLKILLLSRIELWQKATFN